VEFKVRGELESEKLRKTENLSKQNPENQQNLLHNTTRRKKKKKPKAQFWEFTEKVISRSFGTLYLHDALHAWGVEGVNDGLSSGDLQLMQTPFISRLHNHWVLLVFVLTKPIYGPPLHVFPYIVVRETMRLAQQSSEQPSHFLCRCRHRRPLAPTKPKPKPNQKNETKRNETKQTNERTKIGRPTKIILFVGGGGGGKKKRFFFIFIF
jgi:hypothetical protein